MRENRTLAYARHLLRFSLGLLLLAACSLDAQLPTFEVATVRPSAPIDPVALRSGRAHIGVKIDGARVDIGTASLLRLICIAYQRKPYQVSGPEWLKTTDFDIQAKIPENARPEQVPEMLQGLLTERFGLKVHRDNKEQPVYVLVVAKGGPRLTVSAAEPTPEKAPTEPDPKAATMSLPTAEGEVKMTRTAGGIRLEMPGGEINANVRISVSPGAPPGFRAESSHITMKTLAELLSIGVLDRPVVDATNLSGYYDVLLNISAIDAMNLVTNSMSFPERTGGDGEARRSTSPTPEASEPSGASILSSIQNLGLRLEPRKMPLGTLFVDHIEKVPTAN